MVFSSSLSRAVYPVFSKYTPLRWRMTVILESVLTPNLLTCCHQMRRHNVCLLRSNIFLLAGLLVQYGTFTQTIDASLLVKNWVKQFDEDTHSQSINITGTCSMRELQLISGVGSGLGKKKPNSKLCLALLQISLKSVHLGFFSKYYGLPFWRLELSKASNEKTNLYRENLERTFW